jgi:hypothetical protein
MDGPLDPMETELEGEETWPLSGKPYFDVILAKSHVRPLYQMVIIPSDNFIYLDLQTEKRKIEGK